MIITFKEITEIVEKAQIVFNSMDYMREHINELNMTDEDIKKFNTTINLLDYAINTKFDIKDESFEMLNEINTMNKCINDYETKFIMYFNKL